MELIRILEARLEGSFDQLGSFIEAFESGSAGVGLENFQDSRQTHFPGRSCNGEVKVWMIVGGLQEMAHQDDGQDTSHGDGGDEGLFGAKAEPDADGEKQVAQFFRFLDGGAESDDGEGSNKTQRKG